MPELPEVETVRRSLADRVAGRQIRQVRVLLARTVQHPSPEEFAARLVGDRFTGCQRRGKYLLFAMASGAMLVIHLRMTGRLLLVASGEPLDRHTRLVITLDGGRELRFVDQRTFGTAHWLADPGGVRLIAGLRDLGPEPLARTFTRAALQAALAGRQGTIKGLLLDQRRIAGIGNIYADEALARAGIRPDRRADSLTPAEVARLHAAIRTVLRDGLRHGGTTIRSYVNGRGVPGAFQEHLRTYGREGRPCRRCGRPIQRARVAGRSTFFCAACQT